MSDETKNLENIGARVADALGDGPTSARREAQRQALVKLTVQQRGGLRLRAIVPVAAAALLAAALGFVFYDAPEAEIEFWVGDAASPGKMGRLMKAPENLSLPIRFEGGSEIELNRESVAEVRVSSQEKVLVELKDGDLRARIQGNGTTRWQVAAGPYQVTVMGTTFSVNWDARLAVLDVLVEEGVVKVSGAGLNRREIRLAAGNHLVVNENEVRLGRTGAAPEIQKIETPSAPAADEPADESATEPKATVAKASSSRSGSTQGNQPSDRDEAAEIRRLHAARSYAEAVDTAERAGLGRLLQSLGGDDLWKLASSARYAGRGQTALATLGALRARFSGSERARTATFLLGRTSLELNSDPGAARRWFETYLNENPNGSLAEESLGRLIDACAAAGRPDEAKRRAELYLSRHPRGSFADLARTVLAK